MFFPFSINIIKDGSRFLANYSPDHTQHFSNINRTLNNQETYYLKKTFGPYKDCIIENENEEDFIVNSYESKNMDGISESIFKKLIDSFPTATELTKYASYRIDEIIGDFFNMVEDYKYKYKDYTKEKERWLENYNPSNNMSSLVKDWKYY